MKTCCPHARFADLTKFVHVRVVPPIPRTERRASLISLLYILSGVASLLISAVLMLMLLRAILSWFPLDEESGFAQFLFVTTEPFILPVRAILEQFEFFRSMPIDMSFFITALLLSFLRAIL